MGELKHKTFSDRAVTELVCEPIYFVIDAVEVTFVSCFGYHFLWCQLATTAQTGKMNLFITKTSALCRRLSIPLTFTKNMKFRTRITLGKSFNFDCECEPFCMCMWTCYNQLSCPFEVIREIRSSKFKGKK